MSSVIPFLDELILIEKNVDRNATQKGQTKLTQESLRGNPVPHLKRHQRSCRSWIRSRIKRQRKRC